jgi:DNA/RNA-binding domain of Phe-tRNA-synthetase-like protein
LNAALDTEVARASAMLAERPVAELPAVAAARAAYRILGKDPTRYRLASEALLRRAAQGKGITSVSTVVDVNNLVSLHTGFPVGSARLETLHPPLLFRVGHEGETYEGIGRGEINLRTLPLLADQEGPFGSPTSDSCRSMISADTRSVLLVVYGLGGDEGISRAVDFAAHALTAYCGARQLERWIVVAGG